MRDKVTIRKTLRTFDWRGNGFLSSPKAYPFPAPIGFKLCLRRMRNGKPCHTNGLVYIHYNHWGLGHCEDQRLEMF